MTDEPESRKPRNGSGRFWFGLAASVGYSLIFLIYMWKQWDAVIGLEPNEFAELLAGLCAPLAFLWLVLGFLQQGEELRNSSEALRLQEEELHNLVAQQEQLVAVTRAQFEHERERAEAAEREAERMAQPRLVLRGGSSRSTDGRLLKHYHLENVGTTCTDLRIDFGGLRSDTRVAALATTESRDFELPFELGVFESTQITVQFRDARGKQGIRVFTLRKTGATISVDEDGEPEATSG